MDTLVISPVYNEINTIEEFFFRIRKFYSGDFLFIDDGSIDGTCKVIKRLKDKNTIIIRHSKRCGYGSALRTGFHFALKKDYKKIITIDADLQHDPKHIPTFFSLLEKYEVILGSRYIKFSDCSIVPKDRLIINRYISNLIEILFLWKITDPFCGYRGYTKTFLEKSCLEESSYGISLEILLEIIRTKVTFTEIPVEMIYIDPTRKFLNGLDDPRERLLHYLEVISRKYRKINSLHFNLRII